MVPYMCGQWRSTGALKQHICYLNVSSIAMQWSRNQFRLGGGPRCTGKDRPNLISLVHAIVNEYIYEHTNYNKTLIIVFAKKCLSFILLKKFLSNLPIKTVFWRWTCKMKQWFKRCWVTDSGGSFNPFKGRKASLSCYCGDRYGQVY